MLKPNWRHWLCEMISLALYISLNSRSWQLKSSRAMMFYVADSTLNSLPGLRTRCLWPASPELWLGCVRWFRLLTTITRSVRRRFVINANSRPRSLRLRARRSKGAATPEMKKLPVVICWTRTGLRAITLISTPVATPRITTTRTLDPHRVRSWTPVLVHPSPRTSISVQMVSSLRRNSIIASKRTCVCSVVALVMWLRIAHLRSSLLLRRRPVEPTLRASALRRAQRSQKFKQLLKLCTSQELRWISSYFRGASSQCVHSFFVPIFLHFVIRLFKSFSHCAARQWLLTLFHWFCFCSETFSSSPFYSFDSASSLRWFLGRIYLFLRWSSDHFSDWSHSEFVFLRYQTRLFVDCSLRS